MDWCGAASGSVAREIGRDMSRKKVGRLSGRRGPRLLDKSGQECEDSAWLSELLTGLSAGLLYEEEDLWHERLLIFPVDGNGRWYILTPDADLYIEDLACKTAGGAG